MVILRQTELRLFLFIASHITSLPFDIKISKTPQEKFARQMAAIQETDAKRRPEGRRAGIPYSVARYFFSAQMVYTPSIIIAVKR